MVSKTGHPAPGESETPARAGMETRGGAAVRQTIGSTVSSDTARARYLGPFEKCETRDDAVQV